MKKTKCLGLLLIALGLFVVNALPGNCTTILEDNFDVSHTYYDGITVDVAGTPYDGVFGAAYTKQIDANVTTASILTMDFTTNFFTGIGGSDYAFPMLYKNISGDFTAEMEFTNPIFENYVLYLLACVDLSTSNDVMAGCFPVAGPNGWGFYDYHAEHTAGLRTVDSGDGPYTTNNLCYKVVRTGDNFQAFSRPDSSAAWYMFADFDSTETLPNTLAVGLLACEHGMMGHAYEFKKFTITQETGFFWEERFDYADGLSDAVTGGRWMGWLNDSAPALITNDTAYGSSGKQMVLSQYGVTGFQEVTAYYPDIFANSVFGTIGFSFATINSSNTTDYEIWFSAGDPANTNVAYGSAGPGGIIIDASPSTNSTLTLRLNNDFGSFLIADDISAEMNWHDVRLIIDQSISGPTGGYARIFVDGEYYGEAPFPFPTNNADQVKIDSIDMYQYPQGTVTAADRCLIDNFFIQNTVGYTRYVSPDGDDNNSGLFEDAPYKTIAKALWQLPSGAEGYQSTVVIAEGVYENEHTFIDLTNNFKFGLYCRINVADRPNCYYVNLAGAGAENTIIRQDFSTFGTNNITNLEQTMGIYNRGLKGWTVEDLQVQIPNSPEDIWAWYYGAFAFTDGAEGSLLRNCISKYDIGLARGKPGLHIRGTSNISVENNLFIGGGVGVGLSNGGQTNAVIANCTMVGQTVGTAEGNSGSGVALNGGVLTVDSCLLVDCNKTAVLTGVGDIMTTIGNNMFTCGPDSNTFYVGTGSFVSSNDIFQAVSFETVAGLPYCCGAGNIGYASGLNTVYFDSASTPGNTLGLTKETAFSDFDVIQSKNKGGIDAANRANVMILNGTHTDMFNNEWSGLKYYSISVPYLNVVGESVDKTIINYTTSDTYSGINLRGDGIRLADITVTREEALIPWSWYAALVESWFASDVVLDNVQLIAPAADSHQPLFHAYAGGARSFYNTLFAGGTAAVGLSVDGIEVYLENCTFVDNNGTGEGLGTAALVPEGAQNITAVDCVFEGTLNVANPRNAGAVVTVTDCITNNVQALIKTGATGTVTDSGTISTDPILSSGSGLYYMTANPTYLNWGWRSYAIPESKPWPMHGNDKQRRGYYTEGAVIVDAEIVWTNLSQNGGYYGSGVADDTTLYIACDDYSIQGYEILAINLADGMLDTNRSHFLPEWANGTPLVTDDNLFCGDNSGTVSCFSKVDNSLVWATDIGGDVNSGLNYDDGVIYAKSGATGLFALDASNGDLIWSNLHADASTWSGNGPSMNAQASKIYYKAENGDITGVDTADGSTLFTYTSGAAGFGGQDPIVDDYGYLFCFFRGTDVDPANDVITCLTEDGTEVWSYTLNGYEIEHGGMAFSPDQTTLYFVTLTGVVALNADDGSLKWKSETLGRIRGGLAVGNGGMLFAVYQGLTSPVAVGIYDGGAAAYVEWEIPLDVGEDSYSCPIILPDGDVIVLTDGGEVARFTSGFSPALSPWNVYGNGIQHKGYSDSGPKMFAAEIVWQNESQRPSPGVGGIYGSAVADEDVLYLSVDDYNVGGYDLLAINLADGSVNDTLSQDLAEWANGCPVSVGDYYFCADNGGNVYCYSKVDGSLVWSNDLEGAINNGLNMYRGVVYAKVQSRGVFALNAWTGDLVWSNLFNASDVWSGSGPSLSADGAALYCKTTDGDVIGIDTADGSTIFTYTDAIDNNGKIDPIVDDAGNLFIISKGTDLDPNNDIAYSLSPTGTLQWTYTFTDNKLDHGGLALSVDQATLYVANNSGLTAINTADGTEKWIASYFGKINGNISVGAGNMIFAVTSQEAPIAKVTAIEDKGTSGDFAWDMVVDNTAQADGSLSTPIILEDGDVVVLTMSGTITRLSLPEPGVIGGLVFMLLLFLRRK